MIFFIRFTVSIALATIFDSLFLLIPLVCIGVVHAFVRGQLVFLIQAMVGIVLAALSVWWYHHDYSAEQVTQEAYIGTVTIVQQQKQERYLVQTPQGKQFFVYTKERYKP